MGLIQAISQQNDFSAVDTAISEYILTNLEEFISCSVKEVAKKTYTSPASIVRFCQRFNTTGFSDFKNILLKELLEQQQNTTTVNPNLPFLGNESFEEIGSNLANLMAKTLERSFYTLNFDVVTDVVNLLNSDKTICLFGISNNSILIQDFQYKMLRLGKYVNQCPINGDERLFAANLTTNDIPILVSYSGETSLILSIAKILKNKSIPFVSITGKQKNSLAELSDYNLNVTTEGKSMFNIINFSSELSITYIFNVLYSCLFSMNFEENYIRKISNEQLIRAKDIQFLPLEDLNN